MLPHFSISKTGPKRAPLRNQRGSQIAEFGPALVILTCFVLVPLLDLGIVPVRWMLSQELVNDYAKKLALQESVSKSLVTLNADPTLSTRLKKLGGIDVKSIKLQLRAARVERGTQSEESMTVEPPQKIPPPWLPGGSEAPCNYTLEIDVDARMSPAFLFPASWYAIPGITRPVPIHFTAAHIWENLGRDPKTREYYLNE